jgi:polyphosphate glucokinase
MNQILGIDVGGSGIKGALVNVETGEMITPRFRLDMPQPSTPAAAADIVQQIVKHFNYKGKIGIGFPAVVKQNVAKTAANIDKSWIDTNVATALGSGLNDCQLFVANDADIAGVAEMQHGRGKGVMGTVVFITIGTGLGSALFRDGKLIPNTEFGHIRLKDGIVGEKFASASAREKEALSWKKWGKRFNNYLEFIELYLQPDLILLGGGSSKYFEEFKSKITIQTPVEPAILQNGAGIVGAAMYAATLNS